MDINSLLSPPDELSQAVAPKLSEHRPTLNALGSGSSTSSSASSAPPPPTHPHIQQSSDRYPSPGDVNTDDSMDDAPSLNQPGVEPLTEEDYKEMQRLLELIVQHPYQYSAHVQCISLLRRAFLTARGDRKSLLKELRNAREEMIAMFPMIESMWLEWIADEQLEAETFDHRLRVMDLCTRAVTDQVASVRLFKAYGDFVEAQQIYANSGGNHAMAPELLSEFKELFQHEVVVDMYRQGAQATMNDIADSHLLWDKYRDLVVQDLETDPCPEKIDFVFRMYSERLQVPHTTISDTFTALSQFVTKYDNANYERVMISYNRLYQATLAKLTDREIFELRLKREVDWSQPPGAEEWNIWSEYLEWETSRPRKKIDERMACALYERCLLRFGEQAKVWADYVYFLMEKGSPTSMPKIISVLQRATRHCPWSGTLWAQHIMALERGFKPFEEVSDAKHQATKTELLDLGGQEELLKVNIAWCGFLKRRAFESDSGEEDLDMAEMGINEAVTESENGKFEDPDYRLQRIQINFYTMAKKLDRARKIWQDLKSSKQTLYEFWLRWYQWELVNGSKESAGTILERANMISDLDWPEKILDVWKTHVEDFGNIVDVESMMVKHQKRSNMITMQREMEAQARVQHQAEQQQPDVIDEGLNPSKDPQSCGKRRRNDDEESNEALPTSKKAKAKDGQSDTVSITTPAIALLDNQGPPPSAQVAKRDRENTTIIVKNLPPKYPEVRIRQYFRDCGTINSLKLIDEKDGKSSTATVEFNAREDVLAAQTKNMKQVDGHKIEIQVGTGSTLYVTNFPAVADERYIRNIFKDCGEIVDIRFPSLKYNTHRRFCYVQFSSAAEAQLGTHLDGMQLGEKEHLVAKISAPNQKKDRSSATSDGREVYIRNIDFQAAEKDVKALFVPFGKIEKVRLPPGPKKGTHKGFGFVIFESKENADASLALDGTMLKSRPLEVSIAQVNPGRQPRHNSVRSISPASAVTSEADNPAPPNVSDVDQASIFGDSTTCNAPSFDDIRKKTLGIMNLSDTVNDTRLRTLFEPFGPLRKLTLRPDHQGAIVEYVNVPDAGKATLAMDGKEIDGMKIEIGELKDLMARKPEKKILKGFEKRHPLPPQLMPAVLRNNAGGQKRRTGLGFSGALTKTTAVVAGKQDVTDSFAKENGDEKPKGGKTNDDFKRMFLSS